MGDLAKNVITYSTAAVSEAVRSARLQNIIINICVNAVLPRLLIRLFLILVAMVGCGRFANLSFVFHFLHFWQ